MDEMTMALLTGLLGTVIGAVLIGGALVAAFLVGKERGRREARGREQEVLDGDTARLRLLEEGYLGLRRELDLVRAAERSALPRDT